MKVLLFYIASLMAFSSYSNSMVLFLQKEQLTNKSVEFYDNASEENKFFQSLLSKYNRAKEENDSLAIIKYLIDLSDLDRYRGDYDMAFDKLWESLLLSKLNDRNEEKILIHRNLGILYDIFNKDNLALEHLSMSVALAKKKNKQQIIDPKQLVSSYFSTAMYWRDKENYAIALQYLDSCSRVTNAPKIQPYIIADRGFCLLKQNKLKEAQKSLYKAKKHLLLEKSPYQVAVYSFLGDLHIAKSQIDSALFYYHKSLKSITKLNVHMEIKPSLLEKMADTYLKMGYTNKAYKYLMESKISYKLLFSTTTNNNQRLFEIKNKYKEHILENEKLIQNQSELIQKKNRERQWVFTICGFIILLGIGIYIVKRQLNKIKKLDYIKTQEAQNNRAILETKNKELTTYSLQLIEKNQAIKELLSAIKKELPQQYSFLKRKYVVSSKSFWEDFNRRFIEINKDFHKTLNNKHPNLSITEQKHCALIRLNLDSSEMSSLLNISLQSVHTSRYRIRKKIGIEHQDSLKKYIRNL